MRMHLDDKGVDGGAEAPQFLRFILSNIAIHCILRGESPNICIYALNNIPAPPPHTHTHIHTHTYTHTHTHTHKFLQTCLRRRIMRVHVRMNLDYESAREGELGL